ncbi:outer membrane protein C [endosymbiont of Sipalinus gigas]|uniref:porin n=1 Tax=endosymbiont of Sipalinus gigas TaxID=1972134 RepID=UPI000DC733B7|nr:porin [endosymbiont of Sipalinus gigas]BBA85290.1 outer membrane protein C [endosymbiont of Sipalinus gigas]
MKYFLFKFTLVILFLITNISCILAKENKFKTKFNIDFYNSRIFNLRDNLVSTFPLMSFELNSKTNIYKNIYGFCYIKHDICINDIDSKNIKYNKTRLSYLGLKHNKIGSLSFGRNYGVLYKPLEYTNTLNYPMLIESCISDNFLSDKASNLITYNTFSLIKNLNLIFQFQFKNLEYTSNPKIESNRTIRESNDIGIGLGAEYSFKNFLKLAAGYNRSLRTYQQIFSTNNKCDIAEGFSLAYEIKKKNVSLSSSYVKKYNMIPYGNLNVKSFFSDDELLKNTDENFGFLSEYDNTQFTLKYTSDIGIVPSISVYKITGIKYLTNNLKEDIENSINFGIKYIINNNLNAFLDFKVVLKSYKRDSYNTLNYLYKNTNNIIFLGLNYKF